MEKPVSILVKETKENLIKACNESGLHISVLQLIVKELLSEIDDLSKKCIENEIEEYKRAILMQEKGGDEECHTN